MPRFSAERNAFAELKEELSMQKKVTLIEHTGGGYRIIMNCRKSPPCCEWRGGGPTLELAILNVMDMIIQSRSEED